MVLMPQAWGSDSLICTGAGAAHFRSSQIVLMDSELKTTDVVLLLKSWGYGWVRGQQRNRELLQATQETTNA